MVKLERKGADKLRIKNSVKGKIKRTGPARNTQGVSKIMLMFYTQTGGIRVSIVLVFFITYTLVIKILLYLFNINKNDLKILINIINMQACVS